MRQNETFSSEETSTGSRKSLTRNQQRWLLDTAPLVVTMAVLAFAIFKYATTFAGGISHQHIIWAEFGDFLSGVSSAVVNLAALYFIYRTFREQREEIEELKRALERSANFQERIAQATHEQAAAATRSADSQVAHVEILREQLGFQRAGEMPYFEPRVTKVHDARGNAALRIVLKNSGGDARDVEFLSAYGDVRSTPDDSRPVTVSRNGEWGLSAENLPNNLGEYVFGVKYKSSMADEPIARSWTVDTRDCSTRQSDWHKGIRLK